MVPSRKPLRYNKWSEYSIYSGYYINTDHKQLQMSPGNGLREEIQSLPPESQKAALEWHEHSFDQEVKSPNVGHVQYYPWPPKTLVPNLEQRDESICANGDMTISKRSANALRNVERDQWTTTYNRSHTGEKK